MSLEPDEAPRQRGLTLLSKTEQMILDLAPAIDRIPKYQRFRYAKRLEDALWELADRVISAACSGQKSKIYRADEQVRLLHALIRHGAERKFLSPKRAGMAGRQLGEIGAMIGAWRKKASK